MTTALASLRDIIGSNTRRIRKDRGLKVDDASTRAGLAKGYWYQIEAGEPNLTIDTLEAIAKVLNVSVRDLLAEPSTVYAQSQRPKPSKRSKKRRAA